MPSSAWKKKHTSELQSHDNLVCRLLLEKKKSARSEEHTSELQSHDNLVCRLLLKKKEERARLRPAGRPGAAGGSPNAGQERPPRRDRVRGSRCFPALFFKALGAPGRPPRPPRGPAPR